MVLKSKSQKSMTTQFQVKFFQLTTNKIHSLKNYIAKIQDKDKAIFELDKDKNVKYNLIDDADVKKNSKNYEKTTIIQLRELNKHQMARMKKTKKYFNQWNTCSLKQKNEVHDKSLDSKVL
nr:hypothetical protein [Mycoplasmopsis bovis]